jgi:poly(3-hydroxybutyrate) depolymerase
MGFIAMNAPRHINKHIEYFEDIMAGNTDKINKHVKFYNEYLSVMDLPAEFYLQTIESVFQKHELPLGKMRYRDRLIDTKAINKTALLCIEGEFDDISGLGQTKAALTMCPNIAERNKSYYMQKDVGHYGVFSGSKFKNFIVPKIVEFTRNL